MTRKDFIEDLRDNVRHEWRHLQFYAYHASSVKGLYSPEYREIFQEQAASELQHVIQFNDLLIGLGADPVESGYPFPLLSDVEDILRYVVEMESQVITRYSQQILDIKDNFTIADARWIEIFLEKQIEDSRQDLDRFTQMLKK